jgi:DNA polymerase-3 subunit epsilon
MKNVTKISDDFTAIDFETATGYSNSACAVGIVTVNSGQVTDKFYSLIRPPQNRYWDRFTNIHGISSRDTESALTFAELYLKLRVLLQGRLLVAHNKSFDRGVLKTTMVHYNLNISDLNIPGWVCTMQLYRKKGFKPYNLSACCDKLDIPLQHHHALSDALACAELYMAYKRQFLFYVLNSHHS